ncbi:MAG: phosphoribosyltransferase [Minisyncoccia bacterium]
METSPPAVRHFSELLDREIHARGFQDDITFCAVPAGGIVLAATLADIHGCAYLSAEKRAVAVATASSREITTIVFGRHRPRLGEKIILIDDVCNNFSTTGAMIELVERYGATVVGIACAFNRSVDVESHFVTVYGLDLPIMTVIRQPIRQYSQDDPFVAGDVQKGNVVWNPKAEWPLLAAAMAAA